MISFIIEKKSPTFTQSCVEWYLCFGPKMVCRNILDRSVKRFTCSLTSRLICNHLASQNNGKAINAIVESLFQGVRDYTKTEIFAKKPRQAKNLWALMQRPGWQKLRLSLVFLGCWFTH